MAMPGRNWKSTTDKYRYGYQGSEINIETDNGAGNQYTTEFRQLDSRFGRWFSPDPVFQPHQSPYNSMNGDPVNLNDPLVNNPPGADKVKDDSDKIVCNDCSDGEYLKRHSKNALFKYDSDGDVIAIIASVDIVFKRGAGMTDKEFKEHKEFFKRDLYDNMVSRVDKYGINYKDVDVYYSVTTRENRSSKQKLIDIFKKDLVRVVIMGGAERGHVNKIGGNTISSYSGVKNTGEPTHEMFHTLGLADRYNYVAVYTDGEIKGHGSTYVNNWSSCFSGW